MRLVVTITNVRYCNGCVGHDGPHTHCGECDTVCIRSAKDDVVAYACPRCGAFDIFVSECDATERAAVDSELRVPDRYVHDHYRVLSN